MGNTVGEAYGYLKRPPGESSQATDQGRGPKPSPADLLS